MADKTGISWTDASWNPLRGCSKVSEGCRNCYAADVAARFSGAGQPYQGLAYKDSAGRGQWTGKIRFIPGKLEEPLRWKRPRRVFVNSMSDVFHPDVPIDQVARIWAVMAAAPHTFQVLTKRPERAREVLKSIEFEDFLALHVRKYQIEGYHYPLPNVWLGTSVEDQEAADKRIPHLLATPVALRFLSCEPLLGPLTLWQYFKAWIQQEEGLHLGPVEKVVQREIHWVIAGGESGPRHRPMEIDWIHDLWHQCLVSRVPFFFKQIAHYKSEQGQDALGKKVQKFPGVPA